MPIDARKFAHALALRARVTAGRTETVVLVAAGNGTTGTQVVNGAVWRDLHDGAVVHVPHAVAGQTFQRGGVSWDAVCELPYTVSLPSDLRYVARCATVGGVGSAARYAVIDAFRAGVGVLNPPVGGPVASAGTHWMLRLRRLV